MSGRPDDCREHQRASLTKDRTAALRFEIQRTGVGPYALLKYHLGVSMGISNSLLDRWVRGSAKTVRPELYELILRTWKSLPDLEENYVLNTPEVQSALREERDRTGVGVKKLLSRREDLPDGLTVSGATNFYRGQVAKIRRDHLAYVLTLWRALPDREFVALTPEIVAELRDHIARSGKGPRAILRGAREKPEGLNSDSVNKWLNGRAAVRKDYLDFVLSLYEASNDRVLVTAKLRAEMNRQMRRTGVTPEALLRTRDADAVRGWMNGTARLARPKDLVLVLKRWRALPDRCRRASRGAAEGFTHPECL